MGPGTVRLPLTKYISCVFEAEFFINGAIKSAILFSHAGVASVINRPNEIKIVGKLRTSFMSRKRVKPRLGNSSVHRRRSSGIILFLAILVRRGYTPAPIYSLFVTIEFGLSILRESRDVFICAKNRSWQEYL